MLLYCPILTGGYPTMLHQAQKLFALKDKGIIMQDETGIMREETWGISNRLSIMLAQKQLGTSHDSMLRNKDTNTVLPTYNVTKLQLS